MRLSKRKNEGQLTFDFYLIETFLDDLEKCKTDKEIEDWTIRIPERLRAALLACLARRFLDRPFSRCPFQGICDRFSF